jgi:urease gamma subunit
VDAGTLVVIISDRDVVINPRALRAAVRSHTVGDLIDDDRPVEAVMARDPHVIEAGSTLEAAARLLVARQINALPVVNDGRRLVGIITSVDCLLATLQPTSRRIDGARCGATGDAAPSNRGAGVSPTSASRPDREIVVLHYEGRGLGPPAIGGSRTYRPTPGRCCAYQRSSSLRPPSRSRPAPSSSSGELGRSRRTLAVGEPAISTPRGAATT